jgi:hypothetical protein
MDRFKRRRKTHASTAIGSIRQLIGGLLYVGFLFKKEPLPKGNNGKRLLF